MFYFFRRTALALSALSLFASGPYNPPRPNPPTSKTQKAKKPKKGDPEVKPAPGTDKGEAPKK